MRVIFFVPYPIEGSSNRYRVNQYVPYLEQHGISCSIRPFVSPDFYKILYKKEYFFRKLLFFFASTFRRLYDLLDARNYDVIFIHRECFPFGPPFFEWILSKLGKPLVYDFDDAIYLSDEQKKTLKTLFKYHQKIPQIVKMSSHVIVCNEYLKEYCAPYNSNVTIIPTSVDTDLFSMREQEHPSKYERAQEKKEIVIGWIGSHSTTKYLHTITSVLRDLAKKYPLKIVYIGANELIDIPGAKTINKKWSLETEVDDFKSLDIGVYPLADDKWVLGKTGFKTIQYMAVGVPGVISNVGTNKTIVKDGVNGLLATTPEEWKEKLTSLIESPELRRKIALGGRKTALDGFSVHANAPKLFSVIQKAAQSHTDILSETRVMKDKDRSTFFKSLVCPYCKTSLASEAFLVENGEIVSGKLTCSSCKRAYPIINTIPRLLPDHLKDELLAYDFFFEEYEEKFPHFFSNLNDVKSLVKKEITKQKMTQQSFGYQWTVFHQMSTSFEKNFMNYIHPITKRYFKGKYGLDVGCGFGRHIYYSALFGAEMFGVDVSSAIDATYKNTGHLKNVHLVQADLYHLPFKKNSFDFVYCFGVLHHLPTPFEGFKSILEVVKQKKDIFIWVYSKSRPFSNSIIEFIRRVSYRIPFRPLYLISYLAAVFDWTLIGPYKALTKFPSIQKLVDPLILSRVKLYAQYPFQVSHADWFDRLSVPIRFYYNQEDIKEWFKKTDVEVVSITPTEKYGWRAYGRRK